MCEYGYVRVSTQKQKVERQIANIKKEYPNAVIIEESYSGISMDRPKWNKLVKALKPGDTIIFDEVSRMARNAQEGFETYLELYNKGIDLIFLKEHYVDTEVFRQTLNNKVTLTGTDVDCILQGVNEYLMILAKKQIEIAFNTAAQEVEYLHMRVSEGIARRKAAGLPVGRAEGSTIETKKAKQAKQEIMKHSKDFGGGLSDVECMKLTGLSRNTYYKYKRQIKEQLEQQEA